MLYIFLCGFCVALLLILLAFAAESDSLAQIIGWVCFATLIVWIIVTLNFMIFGMPVTIMYSNGVWWITL